MSRDFSVPAIVSSSQTMAGVFSFASKSFGEPAGLRLADDFLAAGKNLQRVAGQRVVGLDAALVGERELGELVDLHFARRANWASAFC